MLLLGSTLAHSPIIGIQTGSILATTSRPIIDPDTLSIMAYEVTGPLISVHPTYLMARDIREFSNGHIIIDSADEFIGTSDVIALDKIEQFHLNLIGMRVEDEKKHKLGKINDFTIDMASYYIQQLSVRRPLFKSMNDTELLIHRTQIIEINNHAIIVHSEAKAPEPERSEVAGSYINPFRKPIDTATGETMSTNND